MSLEFSNYLKAQLPSLPDIQALVSDNLIANKVVEIKQKTFEEMQSCVAEVFAWTQNDPRRNFGICNSIDFHIAQDGSPKIIEVNTNAAFLALSYYLYKFQNVDFPIPQFQLSDWLTDIKSELASFGTNIETPVIAIIDEAPSSQRLFVEFLVFQAYLNSQGYTCLIGDPKDLSIKGNEVYLNETKIDFIYNRSTDFLFEEENSKILKSIYQNKLICISPHPEEYLAIADKRKLLNWALTKQDSPYLLKAFEVESTNAEELWSQRKKLFFKPFQSFGSKQSYRGESISKGIYQNLIGKGFIAQEFCPASEHIFLQAGEQMKFKADFRVYCYKDKVENIICRLYQGQVTNLKTLGGGFAPVRII